MDYSKNLNECKILSLRIAVVFGIGDFLRSDYVDLDVVVDGKIMSVDYFIYKLFDSLQFIPDSSITVKDLSPSDCSVIYSFIDLYEQVCNLASLRRAVFDYTIVKTMMFAQGHISCSCLNLEYKEEVDDEEY